MSDRPSLDPILTEIYEERAERPESIQLLEIMIALRNEQGTVLKRELRRHLDEQQLLQDFDLRDQLLGPLEKLGLIEKRQALQQGIWKHVGWEITEAGLLFKSLHTPTNAGHRARPSALADPAPDLSNG